jgi:hypothetical protein
MKTNKTAPTHLLEARVAQILNARELVINIGESSGVKQGMKFAVLSESPTEIRDPVTNELLDTIDRVKVKVRASEVRPKVTVCKTYLVRTIPGGPLYANFPVLRLGDLTKPPEKVVDTLKAADKDLPAPLSPEESYVKIDDRVIQLIEDE